MIRDIDSASKPKDSAPEPKKAIKKIPCFLCGALRIKSRLYRHLKKDHPDEEISCCLCDSRLDNFVDLTKHLAESHEAPDPVPICDICGVYSVSDDQLVAHVKRAHPKAKTEIVACPLCSKLVAMLLLTSLMNCRTVGN